jgi:hypothetical protein
LLAGGFATRVAAKPEMAYPSTRFLGAPSRHTSGRSARGTSVGSSRASRGWRTPPVNKPRRCLAFHAD